MKKTIISLLLVLGIILTACSSMPSSTEAPLELGIPTKPKPPRNPRGRISRGSSKKLWKNLQKRQKPEIKMMQFTDDLGQTILLSEYPQAIVSLSPSTTEILFAIGAGDQIVGREEFSLYPEEALEVASIGSLWGEMPIEAILALEPDLVVAAQIISEEQVQSLVDLGLQVFWQANPSDFDGLYENLMDLAVLTGHEFEAEALNTDLLARVVPFWIQLPHIISTLLCSMSWTAQNPPIHGQRDQELSSITSSDSLGG